MNADKVLPALVDAVIALDHFVQEIASYQNEPVPYYRVRRGAEMVREAVSALNAVKQEQ